MLQLHPEATEDVVVPWRSSIPSSKYQIVRVLHQE